MSFESPIDRLFPFYTSSVMSTKVLISFQYNHPVIITLDGAIEQLPSFTNEIHHHDSVFAI